MNRDPRQHAIGNKNSHLEQQQQQQQQQHSHSSLSAMNPMSNNPFGQQQQQGGGGGGGRPYQSRLNANILGGAQAQSHQQQLSNEAFQQQMRSILDREQVLRQAAALAYPSAQQQQQHQQQHQQQDMSSQYTSLSQQLARQALGLGNLTPAPSATAHDFAGITDRLNQSALERLDRLLEAQRSRDQTLAQHRSTTNTAHVPDVLSLERMLAERTIRQRSSLEEVARLNRLKELEQLRLQEAILASGGLHAAGGSLFRQSEQLIQPRMMQNVVQPSPPQPLLRTHTSTDSAVRLGKRKAAESDEDSNSTTSGAKKPRSVQPSLFPLPPVRERSGPITAGLDSYRNLWSKLSPSSKIRKEIFRRRIQRNQVQLLGESRSVILSAKRRKQAAALKDAR